MTEQVAWRHPELAAPPLRSARAFLAAHRSVRAFVGEPASLLGLAILLIFILAAIFADQLAPDDPIKLNIAQRVKPPIWEDGGIPQSLLGTDLLGRDILSRIIHGARVSLAIGFAAATLSGAVGVLIGLIAGFLGGRCDEILMRIAEIQYSLPWLVIAIAIVAIVGPGMWNLVAILTFWTWVGFARVTRGGALSEREQDYVLAARALGAGELRIMLLHVLPNILPAIIVIWSFTVSQVILAESALSFVGLGIQPPTPAWGSMASEGRAYISSAWWIITFPGLAIMLVVLAINLLGDSLRDVLDPHLQSAGRRFLS